jgi:hypothetical protein
MREIRKRDRGEARTKGREKIPKIEGRGRDKREEGKRQSGEMEERGGGEMQEETEGTKGRDIGVETDGKRHRGS